MKKASPRIEISMHSLRKVANRPDFQRQVAVDEAKAALRRFEKNEAKEMLRAGGYWRRMRNVMCVTALASLCAYFARLGSTAGLLLWILSFSGFLSCALSLAWRINTSKKRLAALREDSEEDLRRSSAPVVAHEIELRQTLRALNAKFKMASEALELEKSATQGRAIGQTPAGRKLAASAENASLPAPARTSRRL